MMDITMTHDRFGCSTQRTNGALTHRVSSTDGDLKNTVRKEIRHYRHLYVDKSDPVIFLSVTVNTWGHVYDTFHFLRTTRLTNLKDSVRLILTKSSTMRVTIPIDLSTWPFIPLPRFFNSRRPAPLLNPFLVIFP